MSASKLVTAARRARRHAHAALLGFQGRRGARDDDGRIVTGCNVENATYGLTVCAERVAMFKALSEGHRRFRRIAVVADTDAPTPPCGACRQILWEFGGDLEVILANLKRETGRHQLKDLLPAAVRSKKPLKPRTIGSDVRSTPFERERRREARAA